LAEGHYDRLYDKLGSHCAQIDGVEGVNFAVWAPRARSVSVIEWVSAGDGQRHQMRKLEPGGIWEVFVPGLGDGVAYNYEVTTSLGHNVIKTDPVAFATEAPPGTASIVFSPSYAFRDDGWMERRARWDPFASPLSIYEVHLGSWRRHEDGRPLSYRELAAALPAYIADLGFTHAELLPLAEHPFGGSWGYQTTNYFAPTARYGTPDDFTFLIDSLHQAGIGVIVDWVPAHFPKDEWALARFDGDALYEDSDPRKGEHPDWQTLVFDYGRPEVRSFLISSTLFWARRFHIDGFRVDAVASMLYLDYSRTKGEWTPNRLGGRENLEAVQFITELTTTVHAEHPDVLLIAEESGAWPGVTAPVDQGGLGFDFKWNLGWMHDTLQHFGREPAQRRGHLEDLTFTLMYAWSERYILPLSHDEVVHEKRSLLVKMPGDETQRAASLRSLLAYMWAYPGKQLLFMGGELAQEREWNHDAALDWDLLKDRSHAGVQQLVRDLNRLYLDLPELWQQDHSADAFQWTAATEADNGIVSFSRSGADGRHVICVCNLTGVLWSGFRIGVPTLGPLEEVLNTDAATYGGDGITNAGSLESTPQAAQGQPHSVVLTLAPTTTLWLHT
jgi:1,4-alpha-glucan branching enzyme